MTIQQPIYFWALLGLLVPLIIHLWSRKSGKTIKVGSVQWMIAAENTRLSSIRFNEAGLYLLRSGLVLVVVFILLDVSQQQPKKAARLPTQWLLTEEAMLSHPTARLAIDSLQQKGYAIHLLQPGMPEVLPTQLTAIKTSLSTNSAKASNVDYWSFLRELDTQPAAPEQVWILAPNAARNFTGNRPQLSLKVQWLPLPIERKQVFLADALQLPNDSLWLSIGISTKEGTHLLKEKVKQQPSIQIKDLPLINVQRQQVSFATAPQNTVPIRQPKAQNVQLLYDNDFALDQQYLAAALQAVGEYIGVEVKVYATKKLDATRKTDWLVVLKKGKLVAKDYEKTGTRKLFYQAKNVAQWIISDSSQAQVHWLCQRLNPELNPQVLEVGLLEELTQCLFANPTATARIRKFDQRQLSNTQAVPQTIAQQRRSTVPTTKTQSFRGWLWWLLAVGVLIERVLANRGNSHYKLVTNQQKSLENTQ
ncbi:BatA domain-containing protein [uncultured Microscilla sp.]|uniref:BatA domain-containing protein n=1 Tax=uncultured Microscilla sp. TaxID=432653 RepID=UPI00262C157F|nr:BatA domain-containing protein [uncultured Microscilla sp.]